MIVAVPAAGHSRWQRAQDAWAGSTSMIPIEYSTPLLALLLFFPVSKLIWVLSVRRLQRRLARELSPEELNAQLKRARILGATRRGFLNSHRPLSALRRPMTNDDRPTTMDRHHHWPFVISRSSSVVRHQSFATQRGQRPH